MSKPLATDFFIHKAIACPVYMKNDNSEYYNSSGEFSLVNGIKGSKNHGDGNWKGFNGVDLIATVDMGEVKTFSEVKVGFLQNVGAWIFFPTEMIAEVSADGKNFMKIGTAKNKVSNMEPERLVQELRIKRKVKGQFIRITAKNLGTCPEDHAGEGKPAWLFVDEIVVE